MTFGVGQEVICVDASLPPNPWHREHPLRWGAVYIVRVIDKHDPTYIGIDSSRRLWEMNRFRPRPRATDIGFAHEILRTVSRKDRVSA